MNGKVNRKSRNVKTENAERIIPSAFVIHISIKNLVLTF